MISGRLAALWPDPATVGLLLVHFRQTWRGETIKNSLRACAASTPLRPAVLASNQVKDVSHITWSIMCPAGSSQSSRAEAEQPEDQPPANRNGIGLTPDRGRPYRHNAYPPSVPAGFSWRARSRPFVDEPEAPPKALGPAGAAPKAPPLPPAIRASGAQNLLVSLQPSSTPPPFAPRRLRAPQVADTCDSPAIAASSRHRPQRRSGPHCP